MEVSSDHADARYIFVIVSGGFQNKRGRSGRIERPTVLAARNCARRSLRAGVAWLSRPTTCAICHVAISWFELT